MTWATILAAIIVGSATIYAAVLAGRAAKRAQVAAKSTQADAAQRQQDRERMRVQGEQIADLQFDLLAMRRWGFRVQGMLASAGLHPPEMPHLRSEEQE